MCWITVELEPGYWNLSQKCAYQNHAEGPLPRAVELFNEIRHQSLACGLCQSACPNGTIRLTTETVADPGTGKTKKQLVRYEYDLGSCMFCHLCVNACPTGAIRFSTDFEHAVYTREKLVKQLNKQ